MGLPGAAPSLAALFAHDGALQARRRGGLSEPALLPLFRGEFVLLGIYALGWQQILKRLPLTLAYTNKAVTLVWSIVFGVLLFHETVSLKQLIGCALAVAGVVLFVRADGEEAAHEP